MLSDFSAREVAEWRDARLKQVAPGTVNRELNLKPEDINGPVVTLPMTKNGSARKVSLSKRALELISFMPKLSLLFDKHF